jgi:sec-independent protein translocase protein TatA
LIEAGDRRAPAGALELKRKHHREENDMPNIGPMELAIVLVIALLILGPKKLPAAGRSLGEGLRGFKDSLSGTRADAEPAEERRVEA